MKILGINRVELAVHDPNKEAGVMAELFGMRFQTSETAEHGVLSRTDFGSGLELAGPSRADSAIAPLLKDRGEGLLTIVFRVDSVDALIEMAVNAMRLGACDFVEKPWNNQRLIQIIRQQLKLAGLQVQNQKLNSNWSPLKSRILSGAQKQWKDYYVKSIPWRQRMPVFY